MSTVKPGSFKVKSRFYFVNLATKFKPLFRNSLNKNLLKESVNIDVDDGNNQGIISAGDNVAVTEKVTTLEPIATIVPVETDENSILNEKFVIMIPTILAVCLVILIVAYIFIIRPWMKNRLRTNNQVTTGSWNSQPSQHILRNL